MRREAVRLLACALLSFLAGTLALAVAGSVTMRHVLDAPFGVEHDHALAVVRGALLATALAGTVLAFGRMWAVPRRAAAACGAACIGAAWAASSWTSDIGMGVLLAIPAALLGVAIAFGGRMSRRVSVPTMVLAVAAGTAIAAPLFVAREADLNRDYEERIARNSDRIEAANERADARIREDQLRAVRLDRAEQAYVAHVSGAQAIRLNMSSARCELRGETATWCTVKTADGLPGPTLTIDGRREADDAAWELEPGAELTTS